MKRVEDLPTEWDRIADYLDEHPEPGGGFRAMARRTCAHELRDRMRWIPVTECLPERDGRYEVWFDGQPDFAKRLGESWWLVGQRLSGVTHWLPLPKGPAL